MASPFPVTFPAEEVATLVKKIRNPDSVSNRDAIAAGWWIVGYGLGQLIPGQVAAASMTAEDVAKILGDPHATSVATAIPWQAVLPVLFDLLKLWLSKGN